MPVKTHSEGSLEESAVLIGQGPTGQWTTRPHNMTLPCQGLAGPQLSRCLFLLPWLLQQVVIFSTVRANLGGRLGFVVDRRRMNVALTRTARAVVVVGHGSTLATDELWGEFVGQAAVM